MASSPSEPVYPGHEGHVISALYNECTAHLPAENEDDSDEAAEAFDAAMEAYWADHFPVGDDDIWACEETRYGPFCRTCYEASEAYQDGEEPPLLVAQNEGAERA